MHAGGHVGSAAFPVFLSADKRSSAIHARFFLHEYDWGFNERQTIHRIEEALQRLRSDIAIAKKIIEARTELPPNLLNAIGGEAAPAIVSPEEAVKYEIVSEVSDLSQTGRIATWVSGTTP
jgi:ATP-dependent protease ClpP protease subunit